MNRIQSLVLRAKRGDVVAYEAIINDYKPTLQRRARHVAGRNPYVDREDVESKLLWALHRAIEEYDALRGEFEHFVNFALAQEAKNATVVAAMDSHKRYSSASDDVDVIDCVDWEAELLADLAVEEYCQAVSGEDTTLPRIVTMLSQGMTYEEIAKACGRDGTPAALKMWTSRKVAMIREKLRKTTV